MEQSNVKTPIPPEKRLKRFMYLSTEVPKYSSGDKYFHKYYEPEKASSVRELLVAGKWADVQKIIIQAKDNKNIPEKDPVLFLLALCARSKDLCDKVVREKALTAEDLPICCKEKHHEKLQKEVYTFVKEYCKNIEELTLFVKFFISVGEHKGFGMGFKKCIKEWYIDKSPTEFVETVTKNRGAHGWLHKDLFKMLHPCIKKESEEYKSKAVTLTYVLRSYEDAKEQFTDSASADVLEYIEKVERFKHCEDPKDAANMLREYKLSLSYVPAHLLKSIEVWEALLPTLSMQEVLSFLPRFHKLGYFKQNTPFENAIIEILNNKEKIVESKIHPIQVFIAHQNYISGGKHIDFKKLEHLKEKEGATAEVKPKVRVSSHVLNVLLNKTMVLSYQNVEITKQRYLITIDGRDSIKKERCFKSSQIPAVKAAIAIAYYLLKTEQNVIVGVMHENNSFYPLSITKDISAKQMENKILSESKGYVLMHKPFEWAQKKNKKIDTFINIFTNPSVFKQSPKEMRAGICIKSVLNNYREKMKLPNTKLINISLCYHSLKVAADSEDREKSDTANLGLLDICGFNERLPTVLSSFVRDQFE